MDDLDRLARPPRRLLGRLSRTGPTRRRPRLRVGCPGPGRDRPASPARGVPPRRPGARRGSRPDPRRSTRHGEASGSPPISSLDLTWTTDGVAYHYVAHDSLRDPLPGDGHASPSAARRSTVDGQGQRDHSWGVRDWWAFGWCWCSMRLDDGTRVHLADIRIPGMPAFFGYVQTPGAVHPVTALSVVEDWASTASRVAAPRSTSPPQPAHDLGIEVTPVAFGPVLLRNDDGRTSRFPRAMVGLPHRRRPRRARAGSSGTSPIRRRDLIAT